MCSALALWSGEASAVVLPPCSNLFAVTAPAPIEAGNVAVYLQPNSESGQVTLVWRDADGLQVPFEVFEPEGSGRIYLRAAVPIAVGLHTLTYSDECSASAPEPIELALQFVSAPPPPPPAQLGELLVHYEAYCPGASSNGLARDFPPPVNVRLAMHPDLEPYAAFMHMSLRDDTGVIDVERWYVGRSFGTTTHARCGSLSPSLPTGGRTFTLEAEILDGPRYDTLTTVADIECAQCEAPPVVRTGGTGGMLDAGSEPVRRPQLESSGCSVARVATKPSSGALLIALAALGLRRRAIIKGR